MKQHRCHEFVLTIGTRQSDRKPRDDPEESLKATKRRQAETPAVGSNTQKIASSSNARKQTYKRGAHLRMIWGLLMQEWLFRDVWFLGIAFMSYRKLYTKIIVIHSRTWPISSYRCVPIYSIILFLFVAVLVVESIPPKMKGRSSDTRNGRQRRISHQTKGEVHKVSRNMHVTSNPSCVLRCTSTILYNNDSQLVLIYLFSVQKNYSKPLSFYASTTTTLDPSSFNQEYVKR